MSDDQIALAMELHYGLGRPWKIVAREMGISFFSLAGKVKRAMNGGMKKFRPPRARKRHPKPVCIDAKMRHAAALQRVKLMRVESDNAADIIKSLRAEIKLLKSRFGAAA